MGHCVNIYVVTKVSIKSKLQVNIHLYAERLTPIRGARNGVSPNEKKINLF